MSVLEHTSIHVGYLFVLIKDSFNEHLEKFEVVLVELVQLAHWSIQRKVVSAQIQFSNQGIHIPMKIPSPNGRKYN